MKRPATRQDLLNFYIFFHFWTTSDDIMTNQLQLPLLDQRILFLFHTDTVRLSHVSCCPAFSFCLEDSKLMLAEFNGYTMEAVQPVWTDERVQRAQRAGAVGVGSHVVRTPDTGHRTTMDVRHIRLQGRRHKKTSKISPCFSFLLPGHPDLQAVESNETQYLLLLVETWSCTVRRESTRSVCYPCAPCRKCHCHIPANSERVREKLISWAQCHR